MSSEQRLRRDEEGERGEIQNVRSCRKHEVSCFSKTPIADCCLLPLSHLSCNS